MVKLRASAVRSTGHGASEGQTEHPCDGDLLRVQNRDEATDEVSKRIDPGVRGINNTVPRRQRANDVESHVVQQFAARQHQERAFALSANPVVPLHTAGFQRPVRVIRAKCLQPLRLIHVQGAIFSDRRIV